jgi:hypothetical protein
VLDPGGPIPLIISRDEAETLIQGKIPGFAEPTPPPPPPEIPKPAVPDLPSGSETGRVPPATETVGPKPQPVPTAPPTRFAPPSVIIPPKVISVFRVLMEQFHQVRLAVFYENTAEKKIFLGFGLRTEEADSTPIIKSSKDALNRIMKGESGIEVVALTPEIEVEVMRTCTPFFTR